MINRILALDVGNRRIGLALSDPVTGHIAQPLFTLHRTTLRADLKSIARVLRKHGVTDIVVGNPLHMSGDQSPQAVKAQAFTAELRAFLPPPLPVFHLWDERLTSWEAHLLLDEAGHPRGPGRRAIIDQVAAVLILEAFLESRAHQP